MLSFLQHQSIQTAFCAINLDLCVCILIMELSFSQFGSSIALVSTYIYSPIRSHTGNVSIIRHDNEQVLYRAKA